MLQRGFAAGLSVEVGQEQVWLAATAILRSLPALRLELRGTPFEAGVLRPYAGLGATVFFPEVAGRAAVGLDVKIFQVHLSGEFAWEHSFHPAPSYEPDSALLSVGVGWRFE